LKHYIREDQFRHKKALGQHFLRDQDVAFQIVDALKETGYAVLEVGPGLGVLTQFLYPKYAGNFYTVDIDDRLAKIIPEKFPRVHFLHQDVLTLDFEKQFPNGVCVVGNFPYNISTEIIFTVIDNVQYVPEVVGMFQKEVAQRFAAKHGSKVYGVTSVLTQALYEVKYLFDVPAHLFDPPPKVVSGVIHLKRKETPMEILDKKLFRQVVKAGFSQRRKTLKNALSGLDKELLPAIPEEILGLRAEQLSVEVWVDLSNVFARIKLKNK
jgi:16S rRNA (adenine1518-N6/adenine1519-N6)-dimethyltransferase